MIENLEQIRESLLGDPEVLNQLVYAIEKSKSAMLFLKKVRGKSETVIITPTTLKLTHSQKGMLEPIVMGTKPSADNKFVQYYLNQIFAVEVIDSEDEMKTFEPPKIFTDNKFKSWGHFE
jgi:hypothetical protein